MLGVSVDELIDSNTKVKVQNKKLRNIIIISSFVLMVILIVLLIVVLSINDGNDKKNDLIDQTKKHLQVKLPEIEKYDLIEYYEWQDFNNSVYPDEMYYFVFKKRLLKSTILGWKKCQKK